MVERYAQAKFAMSLDGADYYMAAVRVAFGVPLALLAAALAVAAAFTASSTSTWLIVLLGVAVAYAALMGGLLLRAARAPAAAMRAAEEGYRVKGKAIIEGLLASKKVNFDDVERDFPGVFENPIIAEAERNLKDDKKPTLLGIFEIEDEYIHGSPFRSKPTASQTPHPP
jgi:hypothetical protein